MTISLSGASPASLVIEIPTVAFPHRTHNFTFEQVDPRSPLLKRLQEAKEKGEPIILIAQKPKAENEPAQPGERPAGMLEEQWKKCQADLAARETWQYNASYTAGVKAKVTAFVMIGNILKLSFETSERVAIHAVTDQAGWQEATLKPWPLETQNVASSELRALSEILRRETIELVKARYPAQFSLSGVFENGAENMAAVKMVRELSALSSPEQLCDYLIDLIMTEDSERQILHAPQGHRQELLEASTLEQRLSKLREITTFSHNMALAFKKLTGAIAMNEALATQREEFMRTLGHMLRIGQHNNYLPDIRRLFESIAGPEEGTAQMGSDLTKLKAQLEAKALSQAMRQEVKEVLQQITEAPFSPETPMLKNFLKWVVKMPWGEQDQSPLNSNLRAVTQTLEDNHYGQPKVKEAVLLYLARKIHAQAHAAQSKGKILCLVGPPGVGKTSIAEVVAKALGLEFVRMAIGGVKDEAALRGFVRTYVGAQPGMPAKLMAKVGKTNPVFLLDEIDKGDEAIQSAALELLDPGQNHGFTDRYLETYDFSQTFFIASANDWEKISPALRDRMEYIYVPSYLSMEKLEIAKRHLIPRALRERGLHNVLWEDDAILEMIERYTWEAGVRDLGRHVSKICDTICKNRVLASQAPGQTGENAPTQDALVTIEYVKSCLGKPTNTYKLSKAEDKVGVVTGLAVSGSGGDLLFFKTTKHKRANGAFEISFTGNFRDTMKESVKVVARIVEDNAEQFGISADTLKTYSAHIHADSISIPKDGPSAGLTMTTAVISALTGIPVRKDVAMTGEIDITGEAQPIGGVREKLVAAARAGIKKVLIPRQNFEQDWDDIPESLRNRPDFEIVPVDTIFDVLDHALVKKPQVKIDFKAVFPPMHKAANNGAMPAGDSSIPAAALS